MTDILASDTMFTMSLTCLSLLISLYHDVFSCQDKRKKGLPVGNAVRKRTQIVRLVRKEKIPYPFKNGWGIFVLAMSSDISGFFAYMCTQLCDNWNIRKTHHMDRSALPSAHHKEDIQIVLFSNLLHIALLVPLQIQILVH